MTKKLPIIPIKWVNENHDTDWDGVPNYKDCNPLNPFKQDDIKFEGYKNPGTFEVERGNKEKRKTLKKYDYSQRHWQCLNCKKTFFSPFKTNCLYCHSSNVKPIVDNLFG